MSCDTFVALPPATDGCVIFGKNSDRPPSEVQEVVYFAEQDHRNGTDVQCTYIEIPQIPHTHAVFLSKPAWMWGAEMGANEHGVCIGNEAVWTKLASDDDKEEKLLGMDLVRLGLERGDTARTAVDVITGLLEQYGQGGPCYEDPAKLDVVYHNSFIVADGTEAWVLETAGKQWAAEKISSGVRNLSNLLTIGTKMDLSSSGLREEAQSQGWKPDDGDLDFAKVLGDEPPKGIGCPGNESPECRYSAGRSLMEQLKDGEFNTSAMISILRDEESGICRLGKTSSATTASQVSVMYPTGSGKRNCHWFTGTPNPARSLFKPFVFTPDVATTTLTVSPTFADDPAKTKPRFQRQVDRSHALYQAHQKLNPLDSNSRYEDLRKMLFELEEGCVREMEEFARSGTKNGEEELADLFKDAVESEIKFYPKSVKLN